MNLTELPRPDYEQPYHWWGVSWQRPAPLTLSALIARNVLTVTEANFLVGELNAGQSIAVVSDVSGAGKSTLLWALTTALRKDLRRIFIRGQYEPFAFDRPASTHSQLPLLMINEISPHLPVYCWGAVRDRLFGADFARYQKAATFHAPSLEAFQWDRSRSFADASLADREAFGITLFLGLVAGDDPHAAFRVTDIRTRC